MPISDTRKLNTPWESLLSKANTSDSKEFYEEALPSYLDVHPAEQFGSAIPKIPPVLSFGQTLEGIKRVRMPLTRDNSTPTGWVLLETWKSGWSSGSVAANDVILTTGIGQKYGDGYLPTLWGGSSGNTQIFPLDPSSPVVKLRDGTVVTGSLRAETGTTQVNSLWIEFYVFAGDSLLTRLENASSAMAQIAIGLTGTKNSINTEFQIPSQINSSKSVSILYNGVELSEGADYTKIGSAITMNASPDPFDSLVALGYAV